MNANHILKGSTKGFEWLGSRTIDPITGKDFEVALGEPNYLHIWWLERAFEVAKTVCRIKFPDSISATGFLISENILMTNNHVFEDEEDASKCKLQFNYRLLANGQRDRIEEWDCEPEALFKTNKSLDYSICRIKKKNNQDAGIQNGFNDLRHQQEIFVDERVNIIQHPEGKFQQIAFRENQVKAVEETFIQYLTDTEKGSSGSPVFDDWFNVIALHNKRTRDPVNPYRYYRNQGFRIDVILEEIKDIVYPN